MTTRAVPVDVLTVDDSPEFLAAARELIAGTAGFRAVGEAASAEEGLAAAGRLDPDLVLLDVRLDGMDGIQAARRLHEASPDVVILLISVEDLTDIPAAARNCGAAAFVRKDRLTPKTLGALWARAAPAQRRR
ncbi:MAG: response regulator transcription factor [Solirubrobacteraceae bacterium]